jgi:thiamine biosynthesis lipoprotein
LGTSSTFEIARDRELWRCDFTAMASPCTVLCETPDEALARRIGQYAFAEARRIEQKFSRYRTDSVVHQINNSLNRPITVDNETAKLLQFGATLWQLSEGRFDLTSGVLRRAWRFGPDQVVPDARQIADLIGRVGWQRVNWQPPILTIPSDMEIDLGGIGKEYAVDCVADWVGAITTAPVLVNFGGDLRCTGAVPLRGAWHVGIESIRGTNDVAAYIELKAGALATSGDARRYVEIDGQRFGHILDARTGWPAPGTPRSVTVAADTCSQAGSLSTLAMLQGVDAEAFLKAQQVRHWCLR